MKNITDYEIHIFGMNRCGQHAVLVWMLGMFDKVLFKNNMGKGDFIVDPCGMRPWPFFYYENYGDKISRKKWEAFIEQEKMDAMIFGSENAYVDVFAENYFPIFCKKRKPEMLKKYFGKDGDGYLSKKSIFIPVIRSPHNQAASCLKWRGANHFINKPENFVPLWKSYAKEYLGETKHLNDKIAQATVVPISYDHWFNNEEYRKECFDKMGIDIEYTDKNINRVLGFGKGSSFSRGAKDKKAQEMKVTERWKYGFNNKKADLRDAYLGMLADKELQKLSREIYGDMPFIAKEM